MSVFIASLIFCDSLPFLQSMLKIRDTDAQSNTSFYISDSIYLISHQGCQNKNVPSIHQSMMEKSIHDNELTAVERSSSHRNNFIHDNNFHSNSIFKLLISIIDSNSILYFVSVTRY